MKNKKEIVHEKSNLPLHLKMQKQQLNLDASLKPKTAHEKSKQNYF